jgi:acetyl-CoA carboxylase biotin carboxylase subunit
MKSDSFRKILIANRGEIAMRVMRTCRAMGILSVAVYSDADVNAPHTQYADEAIRIGPSPSRESYLRIDRIIEAARRSGADAVHPGYGFLSENSDFATACAEANVVFIGPSPESIRQMGAKSSARGIATAAGVPIVPGDNGDVQRLDHLRERMLAIGLPVLVKASLGGGGKGMRVIRAAGEIDEALASARREAESAFGDGSLLLESYIEGARHIEVQILGDRHGNLVHLFERDCSLQRRHQKVIEESPSPAVTSELRIRIGEAAVALGRAIGYFNAGTIEFVLAPSGEFFFIEANTRLQVEHPVTEMITGLDLVRLQIEIAEGKPLPFAQSELRTVGHAVEARLYAEDPLNGFLPSTGTIREWIVPETIEGLRIESGIERGMEIGIYYDPLLAKLIAHGPDREASLRKLTYALRCLSVQGVQTNRDFLIWLLEHPEMHRGLTYTDFIRQHLEEFSLEIDEPSVALGASVLVAYLQKSWLEANELFAGLPAGYRNNPYRNPTTQLEFAGEALEVAWRTEGDNRLRVFVRQREMDVYVLEWRKESIRVEIDGVQRTFAISREEGRFHIHSSLGSWTMNHLPRFPEPVGSTDLEMANAPMPGQVLKILVRTGQYVEVGEALVTLEGMKMEQTIRASAAGVVEAILVKPGDLVSPGDLLIHIAAATRSNE